MKNFILVFAATCIMTVAFCQDSLAQLTVDQKSIISKSDTFKIRVEQVLKEKAQYWTNVGTPNRADVNVQMQKRKKFASLIFNSAGFAQNMASRAGDFWLTTVSQPTLDENGIPTADAIGNAFDPTYDYFSGVRTGDDSNTNIDW